MRVSPFPMHAELQIPQKVINLSTLAFVNGLTGQRVRFIGAVHYGSHYIFDQRMTVKASSSFRPRIYFHFVISPILNPSFRIALSSLHQPSSWCHSEALSNLLRPKWSVPIQLAIALSSFASTFELVS